MDEMKRGMNTYMAQEKDRNNWEQAMAARERLIAELREKGVRTPRDPRQMKMRELRKLLH